MRFYEIDIAKGIGIILVVLGHALAYGCQNRLFAMIYAFHMPLFFFLSGFVFKPKDSGAVFFAGKVKSLLWPLVVFQFANLIIFAFLKLAGKVSVFNYVQFSGFWFITTLLYVSCLYYILREVVLRNNVHRDFVLILISLASLALGLVYAGHISGKPNVPIATTAVGLFFYVIGKEIQILYWPFSDKITDCRSRRVVLLSIAVVLLICLYGLTKHMPRTIDMNLSRYVNRTLFPLAALCGILSVLLFSWALRRNRILEWLGGHSLLIFIAHIPMWKAFNHLLSKYAHMVGGEKSCIVFTLSLSGACLFAAFVERYAPWLVGKMILETTTTTRK